MRIVQRISVVAVLSIGIALLLSLFPEPRSGWKGREEPVFRVDRPMQLNQDNLVDAMVRLPLELPLGRVNLEQSVLSVDLFVTDGLTGGQTVYHDLYELSQFALQSTQNVSRILVRVLSTEGQGRQNRELLLAMEAKRDRLPKATHRADASGSLNVRDYLQEHFHITYTQRWKEHF